MLKKSFLVFLLLSNLAIAQKNTLSPYSQGGLGDKIFRGNQISRLMGGLETYSDSIHVNLGNPASYADLKTVVYSLGTNYRGTTLKSATAQQGNETFSIDYFAIAIPTKKINFGFGFYPYTSKGYLLESVVEEGDTTITNTQEEEGGVNKVFFSVGMKITKKLNLGITLNYSFGETTKNLSEQRSITNLDIYSTDKSNYSGIDFKLSVNYKTILKNGLNLFSTIAITPEHTITSDNFRAFYTLDPNVFINGIDIRDIFLLNIDAREIDLGNLSSLGLTIGNEIDLGVGIGKTKKWMAGIQYKLTDLSNFKNDFSGTTKYSYSSGNQISIGGFYIPDYTSFTSYWKRVVYRAGIRFEDTGIRFNNQPIKDFGISFGVELPVRAFSNISIGGEFGSRGSTSNGLVQENYWSIIVGFSLNDIWFVKRKYN